MKKVRLLSVLMAVALLASVIAIPQSVSAAGPEVYVALDNDTPLRIPAGTDQTILRFNVANASEGVLINRVRIGIDSAEIEIQNFTLYQDYKLVGGTEGQFVSGKKEWSYKDFDFAGSFYVPPATTSTFEIKAKLIRGQGTLYVSLNEITAIGATTYKMINIMGAPLNSTQIIVQGSTVPLHILYPHDGQSLTFGDSYVFAVAETPRATGYWFTIMSWGGNEPPFDRFSLDGVLGIHPEDPDYSSIQPGRLTVAVRALVDEGWGRYHWERTTYLEVWILPQGCDPDGCG